MARFDDVQERERRLPAIERFEARATAVLSEAPPLALSNLAVDGNALMAEAGFKPGREIGRALEMLLDLVIEDPALNTRELLLERARTLGPRLRTD